MKIPETSANVGAYYGNEENGQWQPNGVIIDSGVGGGVVGSGDAGIHRPPVYPVHMPRGHMPGYVMAGAYYPPGAYPPVPAPVPDDFADYMWMENEEEFDKQVMQQLEEEALMEQCIEAMLEDEQRERNRPTHNGHKHHMPTTSNGTSLSLEETVSRSKLNPLAAEFVPTFLPKAAAEEKPESPVTETPTEAVTEVVQKTEELTLSSEPVSTAEIVEEDVTKTEEAVTEVVPKTEELKLPSETVCTAETVEEDVTKTEEPVPPQKDPPEVSALDVQPIDKKPSPKDKKDAPKAKVDAKKVVKTEVKVKPKTAPVKSETKVQPKKKEVKPVKSESKMEEKSEEPFTTELSKPQPAAEEPTGFKPINYAAAAKANKPKKPTTPPSTTPPSVTPPAEKQPAKDKLKTDKKDKPKDKVSVHRKNSAK